MGELGKFLLENPDTFRMLVAGVPTIIALILIIYAHRAVSGRLHTETQAGFDENARSYRRILNAVWGVALLMFLVHGGAYLYPLIFGGKHVYLGYIDELPPGADVKFISVERGYAEPTQNIDDPNSTRTAWAVMHTRPLNAITFDVRAVDDYRVRCSMKGELRRGEDMYFLAHYQGQGIDSLLTIDKPEFAGTTRTCHHNFRFEAPTEKLAPPTDGGMEDLQDDAFMNLPMFGLIRAAFAQQTLPRMELDALRDALHNEVYDVRQDARKTLLQHYASYSDWIEQVAKTPSLATEREIGAITWALSRRRGEPWRNLNMEPDTSAQVTRFMLSNALSDSTYVRENVKRFVISYPTVDMQAMVDRVAARADGKTRQYAQTLQVHFAYNRGVYQALAVENEQSDPDMLFDALKDLNKASELAAGLDAQQAENYLVIDYAKGWVKALGAKQDVGGGLTQQAAQASFETFVSKAEATQPEYNAKWQLDAAQSYISGNTQVFE